MMWKSILAIALGSSVGAISRWLLGMRFNGMLQHLPLGTLLANLGGAYVVGLAIAFFAQNTHLTPEWRLLIITGFCGGLTTFSTFSAEVVTLLQQGNIVWAVYAMMLHLAGSLLMTALGLITWHFLQLH